MRALVLGREARRQGRGRGADLDGRRRPAAACGAMVPSAKRRLPAAEQLEIDLRQNLGVEQRAVLGAGAVVDAVAGAERVEAVRSVRMAAARQQQRVDEAMLRDRRAAAEPELHVDEAAVEAGIVRDQRAVADEVGETPRRSSSKHGWSRRNSSVRPCTSDGVGRDRRGAD